MFNYIMLEHTDFFLVFDDHKIKSLRGCETKGSLRIKKNLPSSKEKCI